MAQVKIQRDFPGGTYFDYSLIKNCRETGFIEIKGGKEIGAKESGGLLKIISENIKSYELGEKVFVSLRGGCSAIGLILSRDSEIDIESDGVLGVLLSGSAEEVKIRIGGSGVVLLLSEDLSIENLKINVGEVNAKVDLTVHNLKSGEVRTISSEGNVQDIYVSTFVEDGECSLKMSGISFGRTALRGKVIVGENGGGNLEISLINFGSGAASPELEVRGSKIKYATHSASVTNVSDEMIGYIGSRGISISDLRSLFTREIL